MRTVLILFATPLLSNCGPPRGAEANNEQSANVQSSGKEDTDLSQIPPGVLAAAKAAQPNLRIATAESETRDGRRYFDIGGTKPDGTELELDIMEDNGRWRVVETQRDIQLPAAPAPVRAAMSAHDAAFVPNRIIESRQEDDVVIYEFFGPAGSDPTGRKVEIRFDGRDASVLAQEWAH